MSDAPGPSPPPRDAILGLTRDALRSLEAGSIEVSASSLSMVPLLRGGERIFWSRTDRPRLGDLLIYIQQPGPIVHRVIWRSSRGWCLTKGDGRGGFDLNRVAADEQLGVVRRIEQSGRTIALDATGARGWAIVTALLSGLGGVCFMPAMLFDRACSRLFTSRSASAGIAPRAIATAFCWRAQRLIQELWYRVGFRLLHPER